MSEDELTAALQELQRAEARVDAATRRKIAARIRQYYPTATTLHAYGEYNEDGLLKLRAKSVTDAEGTTLAKYDDDTLHTVDWDDVCDEVDPDLDQLSERDESYLGDVEISLVQQEGPSRPRTFHRTLVLVEVIGEDPFEGDLGDLHQETYEGPSSGRILTQSSEEVTPQHAAQILIAQASDPSFLGLNEDGTDTQDYQEIHGEA